MKKLMIGVMLFLLLCVGVGYLFFGIEADSLVRKLVGVMSTDTPVTYDDEKISDRISEAITQDLQPVLLDRQVTNLPSDYYQAQAGSVYQFGDLLFVFVLQKNVNTPLLDLPADAQTKRSGVLVSGDDGAHWQSFLVYENPVMAGGLAFHVNPVGMFVKENRFFVDVEDGAGAGSGEGQLTRFVLSDDQTSWEVEGCYYYIQEVYDQTDGPWLLDSSDDCLSIPFTE